MRFCFWTAKTFPYVDACAQGVDFITNITMELDRSNLNQVENNSVFRESQECTIQL